MLHVQKMISQRCKWRLSTKFNFIWLAAKKNSSLTPHICHCKAKLETKKKSFDDIVGIKCSQYGDEIECVTSRFLLAEINDTNVQFSGSRDKNFVFSKRF